MGPFEIGFQFTLGAMSALSAGLAVLVMSHMLVIGLGIVIGKIRE